MSRITVPECEPGDTLSDAMLTTFTNSALTLKASADETNLAPEAIGRYQFDSGDDGILKRFKAIVQPTGSAVFSSATYEVVEHNSVSTDFTFSPTIEMDQYMIFRAHFRCMITDVTIDDPSTVDEDAYFFQVQLHDVNLGWLTPSPTKWGFSMCVRNSGGTHTPDVGIDTSAYDELNFYEYRHVDVCTIYVIPDPVAYEIDQVRWNVKVEDTANSITIGTFSASYFFYAA